MLVSYITTCRSTNKCNQLRMWTLWDRPESHLVAITSSGLATRRILYVVYPRKGRTRSCEDVSQIKICNFAEIIYFCSITGSKKTKKKIDRVTALSCFSKSGMSTIEKIFDQYACTAPNAARREPHHIGYLSNLVYILPPVIIKWVSC